MLRLYIEAPFAAFRPFTAGWYRPTATFMTPSAAYGLAMNLAGCETRRDDGLSPMTVTAFDLPPARIALGVVDDVLPTVQTLYQQLHNYPVGASGKERKDDAKGNKYNITPVRREFLSDLRAIVALEFPTHPEVEEAIRATLSPNTPILDPPRYGLPFLGDNAFLPSKIELVDESVQAKWFEVLTDHPPGSATIRDSTRLTVWIDRQDMSRTKTALYAPGTTAAMPPNSAWTLIDPPKAPNPSSKKGKKA